MQTRWVLAAGMAAALSQPAGAEAPVADSAIVPLFEEACLKGGLTVGAREAALAAGGWQEVPAGELALKLLEPNPMNGDFAKPQTVRQWKRSVGDREVRALLATFRAKGAYQAGCALLVPQTKYSWPYWDAFGALLKPLGVKAKETDLPHYRGYSGKLTDGRRSRATISSKSAVIPGEKGLMHMFIAF
jgi:hypothetical protein